MKYQWHRGLQAQGISADERDEPKTQRSSPKLDHHSRHFGGPVGGSRSTMAIALRNQTKNNLFRGVDNVTYYDTCCT